MHPLHPPWLRLCAAINGVDFCNLLSVNGLMHLPVSIDAYVHVHETSVGCGVLRGKLTEQASRVHTWLTAARLSCSCCCCCCVTLPSNDNDADDEDDTNANH